MTADTITATMWLHLLQTRDPLTAASLGMVAGCTRKRAETILAKMQARGAVRSYRDPSRRNGRAWVVDVACTLPHGVTLQQVFEAVGPAGLIGPVSAEDDACTADDTLPPRGELGHLGRVASVFAIGLQA